MMVRIVIFSLELLIMKKFVLTASFLFATVLYLFSQCLVGVDSNNFDFYSYDFATMQNTDLSLNSSPFIFDTYATVAKGNSNEVVYVGMKENATAGTLKPLIIRYQPVSYTHLTLPTTPYV